MVVLFIVSVVDMICVFFEYLVKYLYVIDDVGCFCGVVVLKDIMLDLFDKCDMIDKMVVYYVYMLFLLFMLDMLFVIVFECFMVF